MDKIYNMRVFCRVVEVGSFTTVAQQTETSAGNISRAISALESGLQTRLIHRTTRKLTLTDAGQQYYPLCKEILEQLDRADAHVRSTIDEPQGRLRVHAMPGLAHSHIMRSIIEYQELHPEVKVDFVLEQSIPNLVEEQFDVSIVAAPALPDSLFISHVIGTSYSILVASPTYLAARAAPAHPGELHAHRSVQLKSPAVQFDRWQLVSEHGEIVVAPPATRITVNDPEAMRIALRAGAGIGALAVYSAIDNIRDGSLVRILPNYHLGNRNVYAVYPSREFVDAKTRTFVAFLKERLGDELAIEERELEDAEILIA